MKEHLRRLKFKGGVLVSARPGQGCTGVGHVLRRPHPRPGWRERLTGGGPPSYAHRIPDRDEAGSRALAELSGRGASPSRCRPAARASSAAACTTPA